MAWSLVGVGSVVQTITTTHTLTEPAGVAAGDLLVACISSRIATNTALTLPVGWTLVASRFTNNVLTTTSASASGVMAYIVRGASAPALTFTHPIAPSVAIGRIVAYRGTQTTGLHTATSGNTAINTTAVSLAGFTTGETNTLLVAAMLGGQEATWSSFAAVTDPTTASGATDTSTAPSSTWRERADSLSATGAQTSLAIFDAVKATAGATGNFTTTASLGAVQSLLAAAFHDVAVTSDAWSRADKSIAVTLSNSDKTATTTGSGGVRSTTTRANGTAGKYYAEFLLAGTAVPVAVGIQSTAGTLTSNVDAFGMNNVGQIIVNAAPGTDLGTPAVGNVVSVAWDAGAERVWFRLNAGDWNLSATANPATGAEGVDVSFAASTPHGLWMRAATTGPAATIRTEADEFTLPPPSGFLSWMGETPRTSTADAWNFYDKSTTVALSSGDKLATVATSTSAAVRSTTTTIGASGKFYVEFLPGGMTTPANATWGVIAKSEILTAETGNVAFIWGDGEASLTSDVGNIGSAIANGDVVCMAWDRANQRIWFRKNGGIWNNSGSADPATNVGGWNVSDLGASECALRFYTYTGNAGISTAVRTEAADLTYSAPTGFTSWMGEAIGPTSINVTGAQTLSAVTQTSDVTVPRNAAASQTMAEAATTGTIQAQEAPRAVTGSQTTSATTQTSAVAAGLAVTGSQTLSPVTPTSAVKVGLAVTGAQNTNAATTLANAKAIATGTAAQTLSGTTQTSGLTLGPASFAVTGAQTLLPVSQVFTASLSAPIITVTGAQATLAVTSAATAAAIASVTGAQTISAVTQTTAAKVTLAVTAGQPLSAATQTSAVSVGLAVTASQTLSPAATSAAAKALAAVTGSQTLSPAATTGTITLTPFGTAVVNGAQTLSAVSQSATAAVLDLYEYDLITETPDFIVTEDGFNIGVTDEPFVTVNGAQTLSAAVTSGTIGAISGYTWVNDGGVWKRAAVFVKHSGAWKPATTHVKQGGVWKRAA